MTKLIPQATREQFAEEHPEAAARQSTFGRWMARRMTEQGKNQTQVARAAGTSQCYLHKLLHSNQPQYRQYQRPSYERAVRIGRALRDVAGAVQAAGYSDLLQGAYKHGSQSAQAACGSYERFQTEMLLGELLDAGYAKLPAAEQDEILALIELKVKKMQTLQPQI